MDFALNNLQRLKCHKTQPTNIYDTGDNYDFLGALSKMHYFICTLNEIKTEVYLEIIDLDLMR